jgi:hypothetical protein
MRCYCDRGTRARREAERGTTVQTVRGFGKTFLGPARGTTLVTVGIATVGLVHVRESIGNMTLRPWVTPRYAV